METVTFHSSDTETGTRRSRKERMNGKYRKSEPILKIENAFDTKKKGM